jgi:hypothetical protein
MFSETPRFQPGPRSYVRTTASTGKIPGPGYYTHNTSTRQLLEKHKDRQVKALDKVAKTGSCARHARTHDVRAIDAHHLYLPGRKKAEEAKEKLERMNIQKALLKSLYASERTVTLLHQIPNMRPFLKDTYGLSEENDLIKELEGELTDRTPNIRGKAAKSAAHDRSSCRDLLHIGNNKKHTLLAVGRHKLNWDLELESSRGPGTYDYEEATGGIIKKSHNWKLKRLDMFEPAADDEQDDDTDDRMSRKDDATRRVQLEGQKTEREHAFRTV